MAYATTDDLAALGLPSSALTNVTTATQQAHLDAAAAKMDGYFRSRATLPLTAYGDDVKLCNVHLAAYSLMCLRGYNPADYDANFRMQHEDCILWLKDVSMGRVHLGATDSDASDREGAADVSTGGSNKTYATGTTGESRGW